jgi:DNA-binding CsgD family transcriptional regulator
MINYANIIDFLASEPTGNALAQHLVLEGDRDAERCGALITIFDNEASARVFGSFGLDVATVNSLTATSLWVHTPWTDATRTGSTLVFPSALKLHHTYPQLNGHGMLRHPCIVWPLSFGKQRIGSVLVQFESGDLPVIAVQTQEVIALCGLYLHFREVLGNPPHGGSDSGAPRSKSVVAPTSLTPRQNLILELMRHGATNSDISRRLDYSESTVKQEVTRIFSYLGVSDRRAAIHAAGNMTRTS